MPFQSILFNKADDNKNIENTEAPAFFTDLNLDQIMEAVTAGWQEYNLPYFFYKPLHDVNAVKYRHEVFQDLENERLFEQIKLFTEKMLLVRRYFGQIDKLYYKHPSAASCKFQL